MKILNLTQGSPEWQQIRGQRFTASEAAAAAGDHKYMSRNELIRLKATGLAAEVNAHQQRIFDQGHKLEEMARSIAEEIMQEELYPCTCEDATGTYLASMDGLNIVGLAGWEHKTINKSLRQANAETLEEHYKWQMDHQMMVTGAERILFMASDGTKSDCNWFWYERDESRIQRLISIWEQFAKDLAEYKPEAKQELVEAEEVYLPALSARVDGTMVVSNIADCLPQLRTLAETEISKPLETDLDFANKEQLIKSVKTTREKLKTLTEATIANFDSLQEFKDAAGEADRILQQLQSHSEKLVKARKEEIKQLIVSDGENALSAHIGELNIRLDKVMLPEIRADFGAAIKGKRNLQSMKDAVADTLAKAKIEANGAAEVIGRNLQSLETEAAGYEFLFNDLQHIATKDNTDFINLVKARVSEHKQAEEERKTAEAEAQQQAETEAQQAQPEPESTVPSYTHKVSATEMSQKAEADVRPQEEVDIACWLFDNADVSQHQANWIARQLVNGQVPHIQINNSKAA